MRIFVAIDCTRKVAFAGLHPWASRLVAAEFLRRLREKRPYNAHYVLTDNGVPFAPLHIYGYRADTGGRIYRTYGVEHRQTGAPVDQGPSLTTEPHQ
jgi:hypothetical protein